jgi:hypothetical protein
MNKDIERKWKAKIKAREWRLANKELGRQHAAYRKEYEKSVANG